MGEQKNQDYIAFLSYRHLPLDKEAAERVQKKIESYIVPKEFREQVGSKKLGHVFRDEDELPASSSLTDSIYFALDHSKLLIVICTPDLPKSKWCEAEIRYFIRTHDRDHVIAVLADGNPEDAFSPLLLHTYDEEGNILSDTEPLAANIAGPAHTIDRKAFRKEIVRLFAAMIGCPFDALWQRDRRTRNRRLLAAGTMAFAVLAVFLIVVLNRNAQIEERNRQISEQNEQIRTQNSKIKEQNTELMTRLSAAYVDSGNTRLENHDVTGALSDAVAALDNEDPKIYDHRVNALLSETLAAYRPEDTYIRQSSILYEQSVDILDLKITPDSRYALFLDRQAVLRCLDLQTNAMLWEKATNDSKTRIYTEVSDDCVLYRNKEAVTCLSLADGAQQWTYAGPDGLTSWTRNYFQAISEDGSLFAVLEFLPYYEDNASSGYQGQLVFLHTDDGSVAGTVSLELPDSARVKQTPYDDDYEYLTAFSPDNACFVCGVSIDESGENSSDRHYRLYLIDLSKMEILHTKTYMPGTSVLFYGAVADAEKSAFQFFAQLSSGIETFRLSWTDGEEEILAGDFVTNTLAAPGGIGKFSDTFSRNSRRLLTCGFNQIVFSDNRMLFFDQRDGSLRNSYSLSDTIVNAWWADRENNILEVVCADGWAITYSIYPEDEERLIGTIRSFQMDQENIRKACPINNGMFLNSKDGSYLTVSGRQPGCLLLLQHPSDPNAVQFSLQDKEYSSFSSIQLLPESEIGMVFYNGDRVRLFNRKSGKFSESVVRDDSASGFDTDNHLILDENSFLHDNERCFMDGTSEEYAEPVIYYPVSDTEKENRAAYELMESMEKSTPKHHLRMADGRILSWSMQLYTELEGYGVWDSDSPRVLTLWIDGIPVTGKTQEDALFFFGEGEHEEPEVLLGSSGLMLIYGRPVRVTADAKGQSRISVEKTAGFYCCDTRTAEVTALSDAGVKTDGAIVAVGTKEDFVAVACRDGHLYLLRPLQDIMLEMQKTYLQGEVTSVCFSEGDEYLLVLNAAGGLDVFRTRDGALLYSEAIPEFFTGITEDDLTYTLHSAMPTADGKQLYVNFHSHALLLEMANENWNRMAVIFEESYYDPETDQVCLYENQGDEEKRLVIEGYPVYDTMDLKVWAEKKLASQ